MRKGRKKSLAREAGGRHIVQNPPEPKAPAAPSPLFRPSGPIPRMLFPGPPHPPENAFVPPTPEDRSPAVATL